MNSLKMLVIGLDGATPERLLEDERLVNFRRLMEAGSYGSLEATLPPTTAPSWFCLAAGQDPGSLGVYGPRDRADRNYRTFRTPDSRSLSQTFLWDQLTRDGGKPVIHGISSPYLPRPFLGVHPPDLTAHAVASEQARTRLRDGIIATTRKQFQIVRELLAHEQWNYFQFLETGLDLIQRAFWRYQDPAHRLYEPENPHREAIRDFYQLLDEELGSLLELLPEETMVLIASTRGSQRCHGGFCINQWLIGEGLLALHGPPSGITPFDRLDVDWSNTRVWAEGWDCASLYFNVRGREPEGTIDPSEYDAFRAELRARLEAMTDPEGQSLGNLVFEPEQVYRMTRNIPPDLIVEFGHLSWRAVDAVGFPSLLVPPQEINGESASPAAQGAFVVAVPGVSGSGPVEGASLLDIAPTVLALGGFEPCPSFQGRALLNRSLADVSPGSADLDADEILLRDRLRGLGYLG